MSALRIFVLVCLCACTTLTSGKSWQAKGRIVGGSSAIEKQFPYQVLLRSRQGDRNFCSGVIINRFYVLTAAHCFFLDNVNKPSHIYGLVNITHVDDVGQRLEFTNIVQHPEFRKRKSRKIETTANLLRAPNLALLRTKEPIEFSKFVNRVNLPTHDVEPGTEAVVSGWGVIQSIDAEKKPTTEDFKFPSTLQYRKVQTMTLDDCVAISKSMESSSKWMPIIDSLDEQKICTRNPIGYGACAGDSGGPLVTPENNTLLGIISWSIGCADGYPDVHTNIYHYVKWINNEMFNLDVYVKNLKISGLDYLLENYAI